jgi:LPS-assembly protein
LKVKTGPAVVLLALLIVRAWPGIAFAAEGDPSRPIHIQADTLTYNKTTRIYHGTGHVMVVQGPLRLDADEGELNVDTGQLTALGHVYLSDGVSNIRGDRLDLNINSSQGVIFHGRMFVVDGNYTVDGSVLERLSETQYQVEDASFTTCIETEGERVPWRIKAGSAELDQGNFFYARHARFCILDIPVLYLPAVVFPAKSERSTGLLTPSVGTSEQQGFKIKQGFFWAINPSQDATFVLDERGKLGYGGTAEYRYILSRTSEGQLFTRYFYDTQNHVERLDVLARHVTKFSEDFQGRIDINYLNQQNNLVVLSENVLQRVATFQESQAYLTKRSDNQVLYGLGRYSQNLSFSDKTTLQTLPEVGYSLLPARLWNLPLYGSMDSAFDSFYRQEGIDARRVDAFPRLWLPMPAGRYFTFTPLAGFRETFYSRRQQADQSTSRELPYVSALLDTHLARRFPNAGGQAILHKIEPAVIYEWVPPSTQSKFPVFNDVDLIEKKNLVTYRLTNRLSTKVFAGEALQNLEFAYLRLTQSQHLTSSPTGKPFSDLRTELVLKTLTPLPMTLDIDSFYNHTETAVAQINTDLSVELTKRFFVGIGERFTRAGTVPVRGDLFNPLSLNEQLVQQQTTHFYTGQMGIVLPYNFNFVTHAYFDKNAGVFPEINYGLFYVGADRCWGVGFLYIQRPAHNSEFAFVFTLGGVGYTDSPFSGLYRALFGRLGLDIQKLR